MAKIKLEFDMDEDRTSAECALRANAMALALWDMSQHLRSEYKYKEHSDEVGEYLELMTSKFYEILKDHRIDLDMLIE